MSVRKRKRDDTPSHGAARPFRRAGGAAMRFKTPNQRIDDVAMRIFGFPITPHFSVVKAPSEELLSHTIGNAIMGFRDDGQPVFAQSQNEITIIKDNGLYVDVEWKKNKRRQTFLRGAIQTPHTISLFKMAFRILVELRRHRKSHDDIRASATLLSGREHKNGQMYLNGEFDGKKVVLKTSHHHKTQLTYILESVIHLLLMCKTPTYVPQLLRVSIDNAGQLIICSEQILNMQTAFSWISTLNSRPPRTNVNLKLWHMLKSFCMGLQQLQTRAGFTHRDSHSNNVYYMDPTKDTSAKITFIDFDFSSIRHNNIKICVPQTLYDTSRECYAQNRSVDMCIFMHTINGTITRTLPKRAQRFIQHILVPLMTQYQTEVQKKLMKMGRPYRKAKIAHEADPQNKALMRQFIIAKRQKDAALDILSLCKGNAGKFSLYSGIQNLAKERQLEFPYMMGFFEWECMTPAEVLKLLNANYNKMK